MLIAASLIIAGEATAQQAVPVPTPEQTVRQTLPPIDPAATVPGGGETGVVRFERSRLQAPLSLEREVVTLSGVRINCVNCGPDGEPEIPRETFQSMFREQGLIGQPITLGEAFGVLETIDTAYRDAGYVFVSALAEEQTFDEAGHVFLVTIVESRIGDITFSFDDGREKPPVAPALRRIANANTDWYGTGGAARLWDIERLLLLFNDVPGVTKATGTPRGRGAGIVDLFVDVEFDPFAGVVFGDTRQSPVLGPGTAGISASLSSVLTAGDALTASAFNTFGDTVDDLEERNTVQLEYELPVNGYGTTADVRGLFSLSKPGDVLETLDINSNQTQFEVGIEHPIVRTRDFSLWGRAGLELDDGFTETAGGALTISDDRVRVASVGGAWQYRSPAIAYARGSMEFRQGLDILDASDRGDADLSRFDGDPTASLIRADVEGEVFLPRLGTPLLADRLSVFSRVSGQYAYEPLLGSEEFAIGGIDGGRGYDPAEATGDHGLAGTLELRHRTRWAGFEMPEAMGGQQVPVTTVLYGFADYGQINNIGAGSPTRENLFSVGAGVRLGLSDTTEFNLEVAQPSERLARTRERDPRVSVSFVHRF